MDKLTTPDIDILRRPFTSDEHEFHRGFPYVTEHAICRRIEAIDPAYEFHITEMSQREKQIIVRASLTIKGVTRQNIGMALIEKTKNDPDRDSGEAEKAAATDALKRCARLFGVGQYLLDVPDHIQDKRALAIFLGEQPRPTTQPPRRNQPPAASSAPRASSHWYQDNAEIKRVAQAIAPKSPTQAATLLGKTLPDFDSADALITAWQAFNAPAQPATPPDQREDEPQREAVPFVVDHFVDTDEMVKPTHWWHDRAQMNLARAATAPRSPEIAAAIIGQSLAHFKSADAFIAAWRAANIPAPAESPTPPSGESDAARQRAQMANELVELRRLELRTTKKGTMYWVGKTKDPNDVSIEVQFWAEHIDQLMRAGWPIPTPDRNGVMPTEHDCGGMVQLILTHDLRPAQVLPAPMPRRTVTGDALQIGMVIDDHGDFYIITHKHPRFVSACIYTDSDFTMTDMLHHNTDYATREHTVIEHPNAAMILKSLRSEIAAYERRHADRFAPIGAAS